MKKLVVSGLTILGLIMGCSMDKGYGVTIHKEEQETDYSSVYAEVPEFSGFPNSEYESALNMSLREGVESSIKEFDGIAQEAAETIPAGFKSDLHLTVNMKRNTNEVISFVQEQYIYTGGAHGSTMWYPQTIHVLSEDPHNLALSELFNDGVDYLENLNLIMAQMTEKEPDKYNELWAEPVLTKENENQFYLTDNDLVIYFPPYVLSYYAKGFIEFPIRLTEISGILKPKFLPPEQKTG